MLYVYIVIIAVSIAGSVFQWINEKKEEREWEIKRKNTWKLFIDTLEGIGCQYQLGEDDDIRIFFDYQGESFFAEIYAETFYVYHIWDTHWCQVELSNISEMSRLRKAINRSNFSTGVTTEYSIDDDTKTTIVYSKLLIWSISKPALRDELNEFFRAHHIIEVEMHKLREQKRDA
ncbi:MAG: hypothetical protein IIW98_03765 [Bacteroidaceae bacterium]|nr:hypothetical protein [Bacteroidaceae bacterium]